MQHLTNAFAALALAVPDALRPAAVAFRVLVRSLESPPNRRARRAARRGHRPALLYHLSGHAARLSRRGG